MTEHNKKKTDTTNDNNAMKQKNRESAEILRECFDAQIMKKLEENPPEIPSYEQFSDMIDRDQRKLRRRRRRITGIAACFIAAMLVGIFACSLPGADVDADNNPKEEIATDDGVIIEDGGWGSSEYADNVWKTEDWGQVEDAKDIVPQLLIPEYIPEGYEFDSFKFEKVETGDAMGDYAFINDSGEILNLELLFNTSSLNALQINDAERSINYKKGKIYVREQENKIATIQSDDGIIIHVIGNIPDEEIVKIINELRS